MLGERCRRCWSGGLLVSHVFTRFRRFESRRVFRPSRGLTSNLFSFVSFVASSRCCVRMCSTAGGLDLRNDLVSLFFSSSRRLAASLPPLPRRDLTSLSFRLSRVLDLNMLCSYVSS